jgi:DNA helicase HerA-like ATPase
MLQLLAEVYSTFPEQGDSDRPELVIFIDEAHLVFENASKTLLDQIESIIKLIRSKGIGIYFVTQNPKDIPADVLSQLGLKVQHALRAFTAKDRKAIKLAAENYPNSPFYDTADELTKLGIGEALVSALSEKGIPTPLAKTMLRAPMSRMDILSAKELEELLYSSKISVKYNEVIDSESAYEILNTKIESINKEKEIFKEQNHSSSKRAGSAMNPVLKVITSATFIRGVFGILNKVLKK